MSVRLDDFQIRKEVQEKLSYIRVHLLGQKSLACDDPDGKDPHRKTSQKELAKLLGISQPETSRLLLGECTPHAQTLERIYKLYFEARYLHWNVQKFYPICALAKAENPHAYRKELPEDMMKILHMTLDKEPLYLETQIARREGVFIDLYIRAANLPPKIEAYSFGNDLEHPTVFVVLVKMGLNYEEQYAKAWDEVLAHVIRSSQSSRNTITISKPVV